MKKFAMAFGLLLIPLMMSAAAGGGEEGGEQNGHGGEKEGLDVGAFIAHHTGDSHDYVIEIPFFKYTLHLPVILWTDKGLSVFSSAKFKGDNEGKVVVTDKKGNKFVKIHEVIYYADKVKDNPHPNVFDFKSRPLDFSFTRNALAILFVFLILLVLIYFTRKVYYEPDKVPRGIAKFIEPLIIFVRDEIAIPNIGPDKYEKYMPYLLTVFFFILLSNLIGLIPFAPFGHNITGNIVVTFVLALFTFILTTLAGNKHYWKHIFNPPVPAFVKPIMIPVEIMGMFIKPFALMVRLFANMFAGHTILISLVLLIFIFGSVLFAPVSGLFYVFMGFIKILVAFLQAYVFTILSALFIGLALAEDHEEEHGEKPELANH
ncbi:MAG: F0F1 ATP synthase subunit A [Chlorobi bacterium]|nr:F0F1 ATP synthase subunit A [Chlorobiota bacterium]